MTKIVEVVDTVGLSQDTISQIEKTMLYVKDYIAEDGVKFVELHNSKGDIIRIFPERIENAHEVTINIVELASVLAHESAKNEMLLSGEITDEDGMWRLEQDSEEDGSGESYEYMPEAQIYFDRWYDKFYSEIIKCKVND